MGLFNLFKKSKNTSFNDDTVILFSENYLEYTLDMIKEFFDVYSKTTSDDWYFLHISQELEHNSNGSTYGYLRFDIQLGFWSDWMLYQYPEIKDFMSDFFTFDPNEKKFTSTQFKTGTTLKGAFPNEHINKLLQKYLDNYEAKHRTIKFKRHSWGAELSKLR